MTFAVTGKDVFFLFLTVKTGCLFCKTKLSNALYPRIRSEGVAGWCNKGFS